MKRPASAVGLRNRFDFRKKNDQTQKAKAKMPLSVPSVKSVVSSDFDSGRRPG
jgi:hypothetical protein